VLAYSPLAGGWLSGKYRKGREVTRRGSPARARSSAAYNATNPATAAKLDAVDALGALAGQAGACSRSLGQAHNWEIGAPPATCGAHDWSDAVHGHAFNSR
jgi:aryl-alcohol dehydrogenase-like predicted oxidoreductase